MCAPCPRLQCLFGIRTCIRASGRLARAYNGRTSPGSPSIRTTYRARCKRSAHRGARLVSSLFALFIFLFLAAGCEKLRPLDTRPLEAAGMNYTTVMQLRDELKITQEEVTEISAVRAAGLSDASCVELVRMARSRGGPFTWSDAVTRLARVDINEPTILDLARSGQLETGVGEIELMRMAGLSEETILVMTRRRAQRLPVMSGASMAQLRNAGMSEGAVRELARRGVNDDEAKVAFSMRRRRVPDSEILRRIPGR